MEKPAVDIRILFETLVEPCKRRLWIFIRRMVQDRAQAEDLYQETLLHAWRALPGYQEKGRFISWLLRIAHNVVRNHWRSRAARPVLVVPPELPEVSDQTESDHRLLASEVRGHLHGRLSQLTREQREVLLLRMHSDLSFGAIAELTGAPLSIVINRMRDALGKLADLMD